MAEVLDEFQFVGRAATYPWDDWLDGRIWKLVHGEDFATASIKSFRTSIANQARKVGLKVKTNVVDGGDTLVVQAYSPDANGSPAKARVARKRTRRTK